MAVLKGNTAVIERLTQVAANQSPPPPPTTTTTTMGNGARQRPLRPLAPPPPLPGRKLSTSSSASLDAVLASPPQKSCPSPNLPLQAVSPGRISSSSGPSPVPPPPPPVGNQHIKVLVEFQGNKGLTDALIGLTFEEFKRECCEAIECVPDTKDQDVKMEYYNVELATWILLNEKAYRKLSNESPDTIQIRLYLKPIARQDQRASSELANNIGTKNGLIKGRQLGPGEQYELRCQLSTGNHSVWKALNKVNDEFVAIKLFSYETAAKKEEFQLQCATPSFAAMTLGVVGIDTLFGLCMEYGERFDQHFANPEIKPQVKKDLLSQAAAAVEAGLHARGWVWTDLKPQNFIVTGRFGTVVKMIDHEHISKPNVMAQASTPR